jgi:hypothetical protein
MNSTRHKRSGPLQCREGRSRLSYCLSSPGRSPSSAQYGSRLLVSVVRRAITPVRGEVRVLLRASVAIADPFPLILRPTIQGQFSFGRRLSGQIRLADHGDGVCQLQDAKVAAIPARFAEPLRPPSAV